MNPQAKVALVTGGARRVGRAIATELARAGCDVAIHCRQSLAQADQLVREIASSGRRAGAFRADLADPTACRGMVDNVVREMGRLDILVNNAAVFEKTPLADADAAAWERILRINLLAPALLARAVAPIMRSAGAGRIINLVDILGQHPIGNHAPYCASKAALISLTRSLALELAPEITVNAIAPGIAIFPEGYDEALRRRLIAKVPLGRAGSPEELAAIVRFLVTGGDYITGQIIAVDGGMSLE